jgi:hypothetical protein
MKWFTRERFDKKDIVSELTVCLLFILLVFVPLLTTHVFLNLVYSFCT